MVCMCCYLCHEEDHQEIEDKFIKDVINNVDDCLKSVVRRSHESSQKCQTSVRNGGN